MLERLTIIPKEIASASDYERFARERLDDNAWNYLVGGAADEITLKENRNAFEKIFLKGKVLTEVKGGNTQLSLFGQDYEHPIFLAPIAYQRLFHPEGELATALGASVMNAVMAVSTLASISIEEVSSATKSPLWFQLYFQAERNQTLQLLKRAEASGYQAIIITVDAPLAGIRNREHRSGFFLSSGISAVNLKDFPPLQSPANPTQRSIFRDLMFSAPTWKDVEWLISSTQLPVLIKGIMSPEDAIHAVNSGVAGIVVSNHGGRILDGLPATITSLPIIAAAVNQRIPILIDSGIRRGSDIFKAIALGASAVFLGRPYIYALATAGALGVAHLLRTLREELEINMALNGCSTLKHIDRSTVLP